MTFAAFFRDTEPGRPGSPTKRQFESSFHGAGALRAEIFRVVEPLAGWPCRSTGMWLAR
jgi:hypothetical protein